MLVSNKQRFKEISTTNSIAATESQALLDSLRSDTVSEVIAQTCQELALKTVLGMPAVDLTNVVRLFQLWTMFMTENANTERERFLSALEERVMGKALDAIIHKAEKESTTEKAVRIVRLSLIESTGEVNLSLIVDSKKVEQITTRLILLETAKKALGIPDPAEPEPADDL